MKITPLLLSGIITSGFILTGCTNGDPLVKEAKKINESQKKEESQQGNNEQSDKELQEFYEEQAKPMEEVIEEMDKEEATLLTTDKDIEAKEEFTDVEEFARYTADILYKFQTLQLDARTYYQFMKTYGTEELKNSLPQEEDAIAIYKSIQDAYLKENMHGESYQVTKPVLDRLGRNGYFYREVLSTKGEEYFITTIIKEDGSWKYSSDDLSPPFEVKN
ncbi:MULTISPECIES: hypothetical protein [Niallia]|uniref:Lipoprotein n=2 Tax=Bacillati TaxID=1783272 RepID=A0A437K7W7_9BACI|nr:MULTISPECIES: hypothetical protein [Niallia]MDK8642438.1 hypothetical protein [Niallia taxi]MED4040584.1 hypothetical protein [Niallia taxi]MED4057024.1 hypothetical protein [Niallia taxi]MED4121630.1 hypothetical protein [Niallia taxi]RVT59535.1 hypothetical protein EM808_19780 [Niallia taxi]